jgi:hypothetical protein
VADPERDWALRHVTDCATCRAELADLATLADDLLLLAPAVDPPAGFHARTVSRIAPPLRAAPRTQPSRASARRWWATATASVVAAAVLGAGVVWWRTADDRALAAQVRDGAVGNAVTVLQLTTDTGTSVGSVYLFRGRPSWLVVSVADAPADGAYEVDLLYGDGTPYRVGTCWVEAGTGTTAYQLAIAPEEIVSLVMTGPDRSRLYARA